MRLPPLIVFTDLDGTLLDHHDYDWSPARPALTHLRDLGIPVIIASSKTAAEIAPLRDDIGFAHCPAIVENGAGLLPAGAQPDGMVADYTRLCAALDALPAPLRAGFQGFGDMTDAEVAQITGLPLDNAALARQRAFSEPGLFHGTKAEQEAFTQALAKAGIQARHGGRFLTLSFGGTKADQMSAIAATYGTPDTVALGDAPNDTEMLEAADYGFVIANPGGTPLPQLDGETTGRIRRSEKPGPAGWNACLLQLLSDKGLIQKG